MQARIDQVSGQVSTWIVGDDDEVVVIDPGEADAVLSAVGEREVLAVICTHGHAGHVRSAVEVAGRDDADVALHPADLVWWREAHAGASPGIEMEDEGVFGVSDVTLEVIHAPGHSPGSVLLYCEALGAVFAGDVAGEDGPVPHDGEYPDFPRQLSAIGEHLLTLPEQTRVLAGHGAEFTVADAEKRFDSWLAAGPGPDARPGTGPDALPAAGSR